MMKNKDAFPDKSGDNTCFETTPSDQHLTHSSQIPCRASICTDHLQFVECRAAGHEEVVSHAAAAAAPSTLDQRSVHRLPSSFKLK
jgi:hypothetical protein